MYKLFTGPANLIYVLKDVVKYYSDPGRRRLPSRNDMNCFPGTATVWSAFPIHRPQCPLQNPAQASRCHKPPWGHALSSSCQHLQRCSSLESSYPTKVDLYTSASAAAWFSRRCHVLSSAFAGSRQDCIPSLNQKRDLQVPGSTTWAATISLSVQYTCCGLSKYYASLKGM